MGPDINRRDLIAAASATSGIALAGCTSVLNQIQDSEDTNGGDQSNAKTEVSFEDTAAPPANKITVEGVGDAFGAEPVAWFHDGAIDDPDDDERHPAHLTLTDDETAEAELVVPVHPTNWMDGGPIEVTIESEDGDISRSGFELDVEPLDPDPGAAERAIDEVEEMFASFASELAYDPEELRGEAVEDLDPRIQPIAAGLQAIDGPDNPNSIRAMVTGDVSFSEELDSDHRPSEAGIQLGNQRRFSIGTSTFERGNDQIVGAHDTTAEAANLQTNDFEQLDTDPDEVEAEIRELVDALIGEIALPVGLGTQQLVVDDLRELSQLKLAAGETVEVTPIGLDIRMSLQEEMETRNERMQNKLIEFIELLLGAVSGVAGIAAAIPYADSPATATLAATTGATGTALSYLGAALDMYDHTLPHTLEDIEIELDPDCFEEDFEETDVPGEWTADLEATPKGWTLEWDEGIGLIPVAGPAARTLLRAGGQPVNEAVEKLLQNIAEYYEYLVVNIWGVEIDSGPITMDGQYALEDGIVPGRDERVVDLSDPEEFDGQLQYQLPWEESDYFAWELDEQGSQTDQTSVVFDSADESRYEPNDVGVTNLRVRTEQDRFNDQIRDSTEEIEVGPIEVDIEHAQTGSTQDIYTLHPEEDILEVPLWADIEKANDEGVKWELEVLQGPTATTPDVSTYGPDNRDAIVDASAVSFGEEDTVIYQIQAESTATGGLREDGYPPRWDTVQIHVTSEAQEFTVSDIHCVDVDDTHTFTAEYGDSEIDFAELDWTMTGPGSLGTNGVFVPTTQGTVTIEFKYVSPSEETVSDDVSFEVSDRCSTISVTSQSTGMFNHTHGCVGHTTLMEYDSDSESPSYDLKIITHPGPKRYVGDFERQLGVRLEIWGNFLPEDAEPGEGEWEIEIPYPNEMESLFSVKAGSWLTGKQDDYVYEWSLGCAESQGYPGMVTLEREEVELDGETVGMYSGHLVQAVDNRISGTEATDDCHIVDVEFTNVLPEETMSCFDDEIPEAPPPEFEELEEPPDS